MQTHVWRRIVRLKNGDRVASVTMMRGHNVARTSVKTYRGEYEKSLALAEREAVEALRAMEAAAQAASTAIPA